MPDSQRQGPLATGPCLNISRPSWTQNQQRPPHSLALLPLHPAPPHSSPLCVCVCALCACVRVFVRTRHIHQPSLPLLTRSASMSNHTTTPLFLRPCSTRHPAAGLGETKHLLGPSGGASGRNCNRSAVCRGPRASFACFRQREG